MSNDFSIAYLKKQESFLVDVIRRCVEAETKFALTQEELSELQQKHSVMSEQLSQVLSGLEATTKERDVIREEHARYRDEILAFGELKEKCDKIEKNYEEHVKNYNLVNEAYQKLALEYEQLKSEYEKLQQTDKKVVNKNTPKKDDWS